MEVSDSFDSQDRDEAEENGYSFLDDIEAEMEEMQHASEPTKLSFKEEPLSTKFMEKARAIDNYLSEQEPFIDQLREYALSEGGLINDQIRKRGWPGLLGLKMESDEEAPSEEALHSHAEFNQVKLDVDRSLKRFPPGIPYAQRVALQDQLTNLILRVITKYPHLKYYQGYHDVAITFLLVVGEDMAFRIMEKLSTEHLRDFMEPTMEKTSFLLNYLYPLLHKLNPTIAAFLDKSGAGTMFCLPWFLTWYGHSLNRYTDVVRLYDFFLASPPLMSLYLAATIVVYRGKDLLALECEMAPVHCFLSELPDNLPLDELVMQAVRLYNEFPPENIEFEVHDRLRKETAARKAEDAKRQIARRRGTYRGGFRQKLERLLPTSKVHLVLIAVSVAMGLYAYLRGDPSLQVR